MSDDFFSGPTRIMGIINLSSNSFFRSSYSANEKQALKTAERLIEDGADMLDIGAESTHPGSEPVPDEQEWKLLEPVVKTLVREIPVPISVDTYKPYVARRVLDLGVHWINDIYGLRFPEMVETVSRYPAGVIIMHMQGTPKTMQLDPQYVDCVEEVYDFLDRRITEAEFAGIPADQIMIDPGIGFGKTVRHNLELVSNLDRFASLEKPMLLGVSRKAFIGKILDLPTDERMEGSLAAAVVGVLKGARVLRVHDVRETARAIKIVEELRKYRKE
ncbi:dihydropteroate synthase [Nitrospina sp. 32_T5]|uniref:dihydropteroate synthase n=1 Tax=unclassified Nitrospina TaxID=2638683 RepID=UPI003F98E79C